MAPPDRGQSGDSTTQKVKDRCVVRLKEKWKPGFENSLKESYWPKWSNVRKNYAKSGDAEIVRLEIRNWPRDALSALCNIAERYNIDADTAWRRVEAKVDNRMESNHNGAIFGLIAKDIQEAEAAFANMDAE